MGIRKIIKLFKDGNVLVCGMRGRGKDLLMSNVIIRRKLPYISNVDYGGQYNPLDFKKLNCGNNTYKDFINGRVKKYEYPYPDKTDVYLSDGGIYFPSQYCNELNRDYKPLTVFQAISRHVGNCNFHANVQNINRLWDKIREQSDTYILCRWCVYIPYVNIVIQRVTIYDRYQSAVDRQKPLILPTRIFEGKEIRFQRRLQMQQYEATHGMIRNMTLIYRNKSRYNTRRFKELLEKGV